MWGRGVLVMGVVALLACATARADTPDQRARALLARMTQDEKLGMMAGQCDPQGHTGVLPGVPRLGIPQVNFNDGPAGVHEEPPTAVDEEPGGACATFQTGEVGAGRATAMPAPLALAATFDPALAHSYGEVVGLEARRKDNQAIFGPDVNIMRDPRGGRTFEAYGEDPFLAGRMAVGWIEGLQGEHVIADVKHFMANNQEAGRQSSDSVVGERAMHEIYMPAFEASVREAHVGTVMAAYNKVNGTYMTENGPLLDGVLKRDWGFDGFVLTDYGAQHSTVAAANAGTDLELPFHQYYDRRALAAAVAAGQISQATIDDHVLRILRTMFRFGLFDHPEWYRPGPVDYAADGRVARQVEQSGIVLLRNAGRTLPLGRGVRSIAVIGSAAAEIHSGGGSSKIAPDHSITPLQAVTARAGPGVAVRYDDGSDPARAAALAARSDVALVFGYDTEGEGVDRPCMALECSSSDPDQDGLIEAVAAANHRTIAVLTTGSPVLTPWSGRVAALLEAWYPGEEGGAALAAVLFGDADPSGRLPVSFPQHPGDVPAGTPDQWPGRGDLGPLQPLPDSFPPPANVLPPKEISYSEGVLVGYRWYDAKGITPAFPFGFGLSYTRFRYSRLRVRGVRVAATVRNVGRRAGTDVAQLYVADPAAGEPPHALAGFARVTLRPGRARRVRFTLAPRAFEHWDVAAHRWAAVPCVGVLVGRSSRELPLRGRSCAARSARALAPGRRRR